MWSTCFTHDYLRYNIFQNCSCLSTPKKTLAQKGQGWKGNMGEEDQKVQIFRYKISKSLDVIYNIICIVNNSVLCICKLLREQVLTVFIIRKTFSNYGWWWLAYCGDHFAVYKMSNHYVVYLKLE